MTGRFAPGHPPQGTLTLSHSPQSVWRFIGGIHWRIVRACCGSHREINHVKQTTLLLPAASEAVSS
jgi:hypothetical protein